MKINKFILMLLAAVTASAILFQACKKEEEPKELTLSALVSGDIDLNSATSPTTVPVEPTIVATFSTNIDAQTANASSITLTQDYDQTKIELDISVSEATITIKPKTTLGTGTLYKLSFSDAIQSTEQKTLSGFERSFTTIGTFAPSGVVAHWNFDGDATDALGKFNPYNDGIVDITYVNSRNENAGKAASFNGTTSIIEIPNGDQLINTNDFTISFWVKAADQGKGHFVMGIGAFFGLQFEMFGGFDGAKFAIQYEMADGSTAAEDMWFPAEATYNETGGWMGWDFAKSIPLDDMISMLKDKWLQVIYTFDGAMKKGTLYYNGEKMKSFDFNLWPEEDIKRTVVGMKYAGQMPDVKNDLAFGFIQSRAGSLWSEEPWGGYNFPDANHFKGLLDDVRVFHKVLTETEIQLMYNSEKP
ncbi:MAG: LamG-like jellyroll fold domain-containing protein [Bacteroidales bacterium]|jgi:hypothetical protein|nr:Ig-like domain-containing protein [Bacteroidales bacterium]MDD3701124.1 Ig-like domain-containing protein [Bacteroidales bacterium]MDY0368571.1 LamG-like jellyroll fold domain-containing protein [Bacteroidales bacterium]